MTNPLSLVIKIKKKAHNLLIFILNRGIIGTIKGGQNMAKFLCSVVIVTIFFLSPGVGNIVAEESSPKTRTKSSITYTPQQGQPKIEVFPGSETKFFLKVVDVQVTFVKDEAGKVTGLIIHQGGKDTQLKR